MGTVHQNVATLYLVANALHNFYTSCRISLLYLSNLCITKFGYWTPSLATEGQLLLTISYHIPHVSESIFQLWLTHRRIWLLHLTVSLLYLKFGYCAPNVVVLRHSLAAFSRTFTLYPVICAVYPTILPLYLVFSLPSPAF